LAAQSQAVALQSQRESEVEMHKQQRQSLRSPLEVLKKHPNKSDADEDEAGEEEEKHRGGGTKSQRVFLGNVLGGGAGYGRVSSEVSSSSSSSSIPSSSSNVGTHAHTLNPIQATGFDEDDEEEFVGRYA